MAFGLKKDVVLKVAKKVANILKTTHRYQVALTRSKDAYLALEERTAKANFQDGDLFISIHVNAHPDKTIGSIETYFQPHNGPGRRHAGGRHGERDLHAQHQRT